MGLKNSFNKTNLDVENSKPSGFFNKDTSTSYSALTTGTPSTTANPGPTQRFIQSYLPFNTYLNNNPVRGEGRLITTVANTNLDVENSLPNGGIPYKQDQDPTVYPIYTTGTPSIDSSYSPSSKFNHTYNPGNVYLDQNPIKGKGKLKFTTANSSLDVENSTPDGGIPYKQYKDPTVYPKYVTGVPSIKANPGPFNKFNHTYNPENVYLDKNPVRGKGRLIAAIAFTPLYVEISLLNKNSPYSPYKQDKDPTVYPIYTTGTPTTKANPGPFSKFKHPYTPGNVYLNKNPIKGKGKLQFITANTNLDVENLTPDGGIPYKPSQDPTIYPGYTTGTPTTKAYVAPPNKFNHAYNPKNVYLDKNPIKGEGKLQSTTANSNLDVEDETPNGGIPYKPSQDPTVYSLLSTGTPTNIANPAAPSSFNQKFIPSKTYLDSIKKLSNKSRLLNLRDPNNLEKSYSIFDATNLDIEKPGVDGGIPYNPLKDPTVYPITTHGKSSANGFFPIPATGASKFNQIFTPKSTYLDFIG